MIRLSGDDRVWGVVAGAGADLEVLLEILRTELEDLSYSLTVIRLSKLLEGLEPLPSQIPEYERIKTLQDLGNRFCGSLGDAAAVVRLGIAEIRRERASTPVKGDRPRRIFLIRSLKRKEEVHLLRRVYGERFFLIGAFQSRQSRQKNLIQRFEKTCPGPKRVWVREAADIAEIDEHESVRTAAAQEEMNAGTLPASAPSNDAGSDSHAPSQTAMIERFGQDVRETFPKSDFFADLSDPAALKEAIRRLIGLLFSREVITPSIDESAMFHAHVAGLMSSNGSRQVGASLLSPGRQMLALGTNEAPRFGGGHYTGEEKTDRREMGLPRVPADDAAELMMREAARIFGYESLTTEELRKRFRGTTILNVREFTRAVHAEMCAILDAGRRGVRTQDATLYSTTFPCHDCAKHIISAGIRQVVFIEPFPKSWAERLHENEIAFSPEHDVVGKVVFRPFLGVAPRRHHQLFYRKANPVDARRAADARPWKDFGGRSAAASELAEIDAILKLSLKEQAFARPSWLSSEISRAEQQRNELPGWLRAQLLEEGED